MTVEEPPVEQASPGAKLPPKDTFRILIMDTIENTVLLKNACKDAGHSVAAAHSIDEAFAFLNGTDHADVIVCAAYLENESLFDFLRKIRADALHRDTMFMTLALAPGPVGVKINGSTESAGKAMGSDVFINMPVFDANLLISEIKKLLPLVPRFEKDKQNKLEIELHNLEEHTFGLNANVNKSAQV